MNTTTNPPSAPRLRVLHLEDNSHDCELVALTLQRAGLDCEILYARSRVEFEAALATATYDLIISDFTMPAYDGAAALVAARQRQPETPFLFVSGTIGEDRAVENLKGGATDYVLKDRLGRLGTAVRRALGEAAERAERKRAEEALRESEEKYRDLFENAYDLIQNVTPDGRLLYVNRAWRDTLGYGPEEWPGVNLLNIVVPDHRKAWEDLTRRVVNGEPIKLAETEFLARDGRLVALEGSVTAKRVKEAPVSLRCIFRDVTEKKELEVKFLRNQRLESLGTLAGGIAHDLNNSLTPIIMSLQLLRLRFSDAESAMLLDTIAGSAQRGAEMVKQVLTFSRGLHGQRGEVQVRHLIKEIENIIKQTFPKSIELDTCIGKDLWIVIGDATQLHQLLLNLCVNARDAMPDGGKLTIKTENVTLDKALAEQNPKAKSGPHLMVSVADTGSGIPPEIRDQIFNPFFTTKPVGRGTGLGLSNVRDIVKGHDGFVVLQSEVGRGSEFKIYLPAQTTAGAAKAKSESVAPPLGKGETILVVDDEISVCTITKETLEMFGYRVMIAPDGARAVELCSHRPHGINLMLTDLGMPIMDGAATIRAVRSLDPQIKIIAASGNSLEAGTTDAKGQAVQAQADAVLQKPYTAERMLKLIREALDAPSPAGTGT